MKLTLMIEGTAAAIAGVLASLPDGGATVLTGSDDDDGPEHAATGDLDADGLPWDERIHASTKVQTARGLWKKRKSVDPELAKAVEAELRARVAPPMPVVPEHPVPMPIPPAPPIPTPTTMPTMQPAPVIPAAPPMPTPTPGVVPFGEFMQKISNLMQEGKITPENVVWLCSVLGINTLTDLNEQSGKIPDAIEQLRTYNLWTD